MAEAQARALSALVSTEALARNPAWRVFDCRHDLMKPELGGELYAASHIPGAAFAHLDRDLSAQKNGRNGRHPLPEASTFIAWLGAQGLRASDTVVCYDGGPGAMAARMWWMLRWVGHDSVGVLDGGFAKWVKENRAVSTDLPQFEPTSYAAKPRPELVVDVSYVAKYLGKSTLLDARAPARWRGDAEPIDPVAGRIPGSLNRFSNDNLTPDGVFKSAAALKEEFSSVLKGRPANEVIHSCGSGVAACHNLLAMEVAGLKGARLYAGSWSEWIADPARPRERG